MSKNLFYTDALIKAETDDYIEWEGIASTGDKDLDGEILAQDGFDLSPIKAGKGFTNDDHGQAYKVKDHARNGVVDEAKVTKEGLYMKGRLWKDHPSSVAYINEMKHKPGMVQLSVEGGVIQRSGSDSKLIKRAIVSGVAFTRNPVNPKTYCSLIKSLSVKDDILEKSISEEVFQENLLQEIEKALAAGAAQYATTTPDNFSGGTVFMSESNENNIKKKKGKKKMLNVSIPTEEIKKAEEAISQEIEKSLEVAPVVEAPKVDETVELVKSLKAQVEAMAAKIESKEDLAKSVVVKEAEDLKKSFTDLQKSLSDERTKVESLSKSLSETQIMLKKSQEMLNRPAVRRQAVTSGDVLKKSNEMAGNINLNSYPQVMNRLEELRKAKKVSDDQVIFYNVRKVLTPDLIKAIQENAEV